MSVIRNMSTLVKYVNTAFGTYTNETALRYIRGYLASYIDSESTDWYKWVKMDNTQYTRIPIHVTDRYGMYMLNWLPYQTTNIHSHAEGGCVFGVVRGNLLETRMLFRPKPPATDLFLASSLPHGLTCNLDAANLANLEMVIAKIKNLNQLSNQYTIQTYDLHTGMVSYINNHIGLHSIRDTFISPSHSIHVYSFLKREVLHDSISQAKNVAP